MTRDKIQQLARDAGAYETVTGSREPIIIFNLVELERFTSLLLEEAAKTCDVTPPQPFRASIEAAHAIRAMKPEVK
jgi:hypothetical protein